MSRITRLWGSLRKNKLEERLDDELQFHIEMRVQQFIAAGMTPEEARYRARRLFGNQNLLKERTREMDTVRWIETLWQDPRYAYRILRRSPIFSAAAVLSLALGIGANTAIFSVMDALMLRTLPVRNPEELVLFGEGQVSGVSDGFPDSAIQRCRLADLGGHVDECLPCGLRTIPYNSCRSRRWLRARRAELLPVHYVHVVFTLPHELAPGRLQFERRLYHFVLSGYSFIHTS
jgi:hypothetical protein